jgi:hypothetical protein
VKKAEHRGSNKGTSGKGDEQSGYQAHRAGAEEAGGVHQSGLNRSESGDQRLHRKGQAVNDRADDEAGEGKRERVAEQCGDAAPESGAGPEQNKKEESEDRGRENQRECGERLNNG